MVKAAIIDIYTDASVDVGKKISCSGIIMVDRRRGKVISEQYLIKENATNNAGEIIAIWLAVNAAIQLFWLSPMPFEVNIYSDSQISLFGCRDWLVRWVRCIKNGQMYSTSGNPVANQEWFEDIYHSVISSRLKLRFYHCKGHINPTNPRLLFRADKQFIRSNNTNCDNIGHSIWQVQYYNDLVDNQSRDNLARYKSSHYLNYKPLNEIFNWEGHYGNPYVGLVTDIPMRFNFTMQEIEIYKQLIKGGYNNPLLY